MADSEAALTKEQQTNNKVANEEYKIWKKQSPFLYDICLAKANDTSSLTVQWFPDRPPYTTKSDFFTTYSLLLGTAGLTAGGNIDYVYKALVDIPSENYDGRAKLINLVSPGQKIAHHGDANRARYSPLNPDLIATIGEHGNAYVFDSTKFSTDSPDESFTPTHQLEGHNAEGFGLGWSFQKEGILATGAADSTVAYWDINGQTERVVPPVWTYRAKGTDHVGVNDVAFSREDANILAAVGEDHSIVIFDARTGKVAAKNEQAHKTAINSVDFAPGSATTFATGGDDGTIGIWDSRSLSQPTKRIQGHALPLSCVRWSPTTPGVLASGGEDRHVKVWEIALGNRELADDSEGPPELVFIHGGHVNRIFDVDWHPSIPWTIASVSEDNIVQVWKIANAIIEKEHETD